MYKTFTMDDAISALVEREVEAARYKMYSEIRDAFAENGHNVQRFSPEKYIELYHNPRSLKRNG